MSAVADFDSCATHVTATFHSNRGLVCSYTLRDVLLLAICTMVDGMRIRLTNLTSDPVRPQTRNAQRRRSPVAQDEARSCSDSPKRPQRMAS
jgi:hypothetical protein